VFHGKEAPENGVEGGLGYYLREEVE